MTVKELIEHLDKCQPGEDVRIRIFNEDGERIQHWLKQVTVEKRCILLIPDQEPTEKPPLND